jgi:hypothetical protein
MSSALEPYRSPDLDSYAPVAVVEPPAVGGAIRFGGALTVDDVLRAARLARSASSKVANILAWAAGVLVALGFMALAAYHVYEDDEYEHVFRAALSLVVVLTAIAFAAAHPQWVRSRQHEAARRGDGLYTPTHGAACDEFLESKTDEAAARFKWSAFYGYRASTDVAILYGRLSRQFVIFARTKFDSDDDWQRFLNLVAHKLPRV